jgi:hypothetical protein
LVVEGRMTIKKTGAIREGSYRPPSAPAALHQAQSDQERRWLMNVNRDKLARPSAKGHGQATDSEQVFQRDWLPPMMQTELATLQRAGPSPLAIPNRIGLVPGSGESL